jgi:hypothetical protein
MSCYCPGMMSEAGGLGFSPWNAPVVVEAVLSRAEPAALKLRRGMNSALASKKASQHSARTGSRTVLMEKKADERLGVCALGGSWFGQMPSSRRAHHRTHPPPDTNTRPDCLSFSCSLTAICGYTTHILWQCCVSFPSVSIQRQSNGGTCSPPVPGFVAVFLTFASPTPPPLMQ